MVIIVRRYNIINCVSAEMNSDVKFSVVQLNADSNGDEVTDIILLNSDDANMDTFSEIPLEFDSSNSSIGTLGCGDDSRGVETELPILTDIAEETIYETEFFDETLKLEDSVINHGKDSLVEESNDISNILMETVSSESNENSVENDIYNQSKHVDSPLKNEHDDFLDSEILETVAESDCSDFIARIEEENRNDLTNKLTDMLVEKLTPLSDSPGDEVSSLITVSNNTNLVSGMLENATLKNLSAPVDKTNNTNVEFLTGSKSTVYTNLSNVIQINAINNKISTLQPITVQSAHKLVPISIAPANLIRRPASVSVKACGQNVSRHRNCRRENGTRRK